MSGVVSPDWNTHGQCGWCAGSGNIVNCWCANCHSEVAATVEGSVAWSLHHMYLCPDCGNKRCPRATRHSLKCTGSNEPGQPGSAYGGLSVR